MSDEDKKQIFDKINDLQKQIYDIQKVGKYSPKSDESSHDDNLSSQSKDASLKD